MVPKKISRNKFPAAVADSHADKGPDHQIKPIMELSARPLPATACCWHLCDVNCVSISPDGTTCASGGDDHRVLISSIEQGQLLCTLSHPCAVNCLVWLQSGRTARQLATGGKNGAVLLWSLRRPNAPTSTCFRTYDFEIETMIYDLASNQLLIGFQNSLAICNLGHVEGLKSEDRKFNCDDVIGGLAFIMAGTGCIVSIPKWRRILFLSNLTTSITAETYLVQFNPHFIAVSSDSMTFAVGGLDGSIHVYAWSLHEKPSEKAVVYYQTSLKTPQTVTFCFIHGSRYLLVGGEAEIATVFDLMDSRKVADLIHQKGCFIQVVAGWSNSEVVRMITASSYGRYYVIIWETSLAWACFRGQVSTKAQRPLCNHDAHVCSRILIAIRNIIVTILVILPFFVAFCALSHANCGVQGIRIDYQTLQEIKRHGSVAMSKYWWALRDYLVI